MRREVGGRKEGERKLTSRRSSISLLHLSLSLPPLPHAHLPKVVHVIDVGLGVGIKVGVGFVVTGSRGEVAEERKEVSSNERREGKKDGERGRPSTSLSTAFPPSHPKQKARCMHSLSHSISEKILSFSIVFLHIPSSCYSSFLLLIHIVLLLVVVVSEPEVIVPLVETEIVLVEIAEGCWWGGWWKGGSVGCW